MNPTNGELIIFLLAIIVVVVYSTYMVHSIKKRRIDFDRTTRVLGKLIGFRIYVPNEPWHDKRLKEDNGEYMVPVFSLNIDGQSKVVDSVWKDKKLTREDIGKSFTVTYQSDKEILISSDEAVEDYVDSMHKFGYSLWIIGAFIVILGVCLIIYLRIDK